jgi:hypothetical protein
VEEEKKENVVCKCKAIMRRLDFFIKSFSDEQLKIFFFEGYQHDNVAFDERIRIIKTAKSKKPVFKDPASESEMELVYYKVRHSWNRFVKQTFFTDQMFAYLFTKSIPYIIGLQFNMCHIDR